MRRQHIDTRNEALERNDQHEHAADAQPAEGVIEEELLDAPVGETANL